MERAGINLDWWANLPSQWKDIFFINVEFSERLTPDMQESANNLGFEADLYEYYESYFSVPFELPNVGNDFIEKLSKLNKVEIMWSNIDNIEPISYLRNLKTLSLHVTKVRSLIPLKNNLLLERVNCSECEITNLFGLENLTNLNYLDLNWNNITDIAPLSNLINLKVLQLRGNPIESLSPLDNLQSIKHLDIGNTKLTEIEVRRFSAIQSQCNIDYYGRYSEKEEPIPIVSSINKKKAEKFLLNGVFSADNKDYSSAISNFNRGIELDPSSERLYYNLGVALQQIGDHKSAIENFKMAINLRPYESQAYFGSSFSKEKLNDNISALDDLNFAIKNENNPANKFRYFYFRGTLHYKMQKFHEAHQDFDKTLEINRNFLIGYIQRARCKYMLQDFTGAIDDITSIINSAQNSPDAFYIRGISRFALGLKRAAYDDLLIAKKNGSDEANHFINKNF